MNIQYHKDTKSLIVKIDGDFDHHSSKKIKESIEKNIGKFNVKNLILDFKKMSFMDSSGIGVIIGRYKDISMNNGKVAIVNVDKRFERILKISGIHKIINIYDSIEKALKHMQGR